MRALPEGRSNAATDQRLRNTDLALPSRLERLRSPLILTAVMSASNRGTHGRTAVYELLEMNEELRAAIQAEATDATLYHAARAGGFTPMMERALALILEGAVDAAEVIERVPKPEVDLAPLPASHPFMARLALAIQRGDLNMRRAKTRDAA